jgi:hypothetical protein
MTKSRRSVAELAVGSSSFREAAAQIDPLYAATHAKSSRFDGAAVTRNCEMLFEQMYRQCRAGLPPDHLTVKHRAPAAHAASGVELRS